MEVVIDGQKDKCSLNEDINFVFTGFGLVGRVRFSLLKYGFIYTYCSYFTTMHLSI